MSGWHAALTSPVFLETEGGKRWLGEGGKMDQGRIFRAAMGYACVWRLLLTCLSALSRASTHGGDGGLATDREPEQRVTALLDISQSD